MEIQMQIKRIGGRWLVNGKRLTEMSDKEKKFLGEFFNLMRTEIKDQYETLESSINK